MTILLQVVAWLIGSKTGRYVALGVLVSISVAILLFRIYAAGEARERARQLEASLRALRERVKVDDEVAKLSPDKRLERLNRWVRDDGE